LAALKHYYRDPRRRTVGHLRAARCLQPFRELGFAHLQGSQQAPIVAMVENYRTGLLWKTFMSNRKSPRC